MYKNNFCMGIIADIHFGKKDDLKLYTELKEHFTKIIKEFKENENKDLNLICIAGDLFDRVIRMNEFSSKLIIDFVSELCEFTNKNNIQFRIIKGTKTHDFNQLQVFKSFELKYSNFKIYHNVGTETLEGLRILYLPEEYPDSIYKYYAEYLNEEYDIILGHGMIDFVAYTGEDDSERMVRNAPVWKSKDLMNITSGPIVFGHIHDMHEYKNKIFYCGSFSRFSFADKEDKGFLVFDINRDNPKEYEVLMYENESAPTYYTIDISDFGDISSEEKIKLINSIKKEYDFVKIKADKNIDENLDLLKTITNSDSSIKMEIKNIAVEDDKIDKDYEFILRKEYDLYETISRYIKLKYNKDISKSKIKELLEVE